MRDELKRILTVRSYWRLTLTCPCDFRLAKADGRWKFDEKQFNATDGQRQCIYERMPRGLSTQVTTIMYVQSVEIGEYVLKTNVIIVAL